MRIAVWYNLPSGGGKRQVYDHLRGLKARGHEIVAWRPPIPQADYLPIGELVEEREVPLESPIASGTGYFQNVARHLVRQKRLRRSMEVHARRAADEIAAGGFDVLFANTCRNYHAPWIGRYLPNLPKLLYLGEPYRPFYEALPRLPWPALPENVRDSWSVGALKRRLKDRLDLGAARIQAADELQNAQSFDRLLVNSNFSRESIRRAYGLDAEVCYLGVDAERFANLKLLREPFVVGLGAFGQEKNPEFVVRAIGTIREGRPPLVWIANMADADYRARIEGLARELGVDLQIRDYVAGDELVQTLNRASAMAYAPRLEPFGYAPLEANACGCPAVVVAEGGVKESVVDGVNGRVVPYRPEAMGAALCELLDDPDGARALGERAAAHVRENWTLERATDEIERNLLEVAGQER